MTPADSLVAAAAAGLPVAGPEVRSLAWGDFDGDGDADLYAGVSRAEGELARNLVFRNDGRGGFMEVAADVGLMLLDADSRQSSWVDYDRDGDLDLFSAQRSGRNRLFRNEGGRFTDVGAELGLDDPRRTVGACWFDMDEDGDLDLFLANQEADKDAFYRNDGATFVDVAPQLGMHQPERTLAEGGVGCTVGDYDNDGRLDLFVATYGDTLLYRNLGGGRFQEMAGESGVRRHLHAVGASWADMRQRRRPRSLRYRLRGNAISRSPVPEPERPVHRCARLLTARCSRRTTGCNGRMSIATATSTCR